MLRRLKYVSEFSRALTPTEIDDIGRAASEKNAQLEITGAFYASGALFFQVLEGPEGVVGELYDTIRRDSRHRSVHLLSDESVDERLFPNWAMRAIDLTRSTDKQPLLAMLDTLFDLESSTVRLSKALEEAMWRQHRDE
jgi:hypothetical protein